MRDVQHGDIHSVSSDEHEKSSDPTNAGPLVKRFDEGMARGQHAPLGANPPPVKYTVGSADSAGNFV